MDLFTRIVVKALEEQKIEVRVPDVSFSLEEKIELVSIAMLKRIQEIIQDDTLTDEECFKKIEAIVCLLEELDIYCGNRHDVG